MMNGVRHMDKLTARQNFIINKLLNKGPLTLKDLSFQIHVSSRTIYREIAAINALLKQEGISIKENNLELFLDGKTEKLNNLKNSLGKMPIQWLLSQEQRIILIAEELLVSQEPIKSAFFSYQFNVVEGTISLYMDKIEKWFEINHLNLQRQRGYGITAAGSEWVKRNTFLELLYEYKKVDELLSYIYEEKQDQEIHVFFSIIFGKDIISISRNILEIVNKDLKMDDITYFSSLIHVMLSLKKIKQGLKIDLPEDLINDVVSSNEFSFINKVKCYLISLNIDIPDSELSYIAIQLSGNKYIYNADRKFEELGVSIEELSKEVIYEIEKKLNIKINLDEQLILGLTQHFRPALYRIKMNLQVKNPLMDEIRKAYGNLFSAVNYACKITFSKYNITLSQDEIGFITMHIEAAIERTEKLNNRLKALIICPNGMGTARILSSKIKAAIPSIDKITIGSIKDWNYSCDYDIVISTTNVRADNVIKVSPFLSQKDINKVNEYINKNIGNFGKFNVSSLTEQENSIDSEEEKYEIINNMLKNIQMENLEPKSFNDMISHISNSVYLNKIVSDKKEIEIQIINRERAGSVAIPNSHTALLHTRSDSVINPFVGVYRVKEYMTLNSTGFSDENVDTFLLLLARKNEQPYILEQMGYISIALIEQKKFTETLRFGNIKEIRSSIIKILNKEDI
jgi:mannitol operon transcriptional antiterminator